MLILILGQDKKNDQTYDAQGMADGLDVLNMKFDKDTQHEGKCQKDQEKDIKHAGYVFDVFRGE